MNLEEGEAGAVVIPNIDIYAEVGQYVALTKTAADVLVSGGALNLSFTRHEENPKVRISFLCRLLYLIEASDSPFMRNRFAAFGSYRWHRRRLHSNHLLRLPQSRHFRWSQVLVQLRRQSRL